MLTSRSPAAAVTPAAVGAVALWSLKPVLIALIGDQVGFAETYLLSGVFAVAVGWGALCARPRVVGRVVSAGAWRAVGDAGVAGVFLALWYYGFYRALMTAGSAPDVVVVSFSWPLIAVVAMRVVSPGSAPALRWFQWVLLVVSFMGVSAVVVGGGDGGGVAGGGALWWAVAAAVGSGVYLPFAVRSAAVLGERAGVSGAWGTVVSISVANVVAVVGTFVVLVGAGVGLDFSGVDAVVVGVCAVIGVGVYLVAEVAWTWAMGAGGSLTLACLPYFSPVVSVVLLAVLFSAPVGWVTVVGLVVVLVSNLVLHFSTGR